MAGSRDAGRDAARGMGSSGSSCCGCWERESARTVGMAGLYLCLTVLYRDVLPLANMYKPMFFCYAILHTQN